RSPVAARTARPPPAFRASGTLEPDRRGGSHSRCSLGDGAYARMRIYRPRGEAEIIRVPCRRRQTRRSRNTDTTGRNREADMALDEAKLNALVGRIVDEFGAIACAPLVLLGDRLGIFRKMAGAGLMDADA